MENKLKKFLYAYKNISNFVKFFVALWVVLLIAIILMTIHKKGLLVLSWTQLSIPIHSIKEKERENINTYVALLELKKIGYSEEYYPAALLFENERRLGPRVKSLENINLLSEGSFYLKTDRLFFSTSDNSDPRTNSRHYTLYLPRSIPLFIQYLIWGMFIILSIIGILIIAFYIATDKFLLSAMIVFLIFIILLSWNTDDAYHSYTMARNLTEGKGFVYNIGERVLAATNPLFTLIVSFVYFFVGNMFTSGLIVCIFCSAFAYYILIYKCCQSKKQVIIESIILISSISFMSYTTSGLENSLLFLLSALLLRIFLHNDTYNKNHLLLATLLFALLAMTRHDVVLLFFPLIIYMFLLKRNKIGFFKSLVYGLLGLSPFIIWELFSLFYYGFLFPNTAYIKLNTGFPLNEYIYRGIQYFIVTLLSDIFVIIIPYSYIVLSIYSKKISHIIISTGILLYSLYIIYIGGDFMIGRHLTVPFFVSLLSYPDLLSTVKLPNIVMSRKTIFQENILLLLLIACVLYNSQFPILSQKIVGIFLNNHVLDERAFYFSRSSFLSNLIHSIRTNEPLGSFIEENINKERSNEVKQHISLGHKGAVISFAPGFLMYYYNKYIYLTDCIGLGDPLLARLPAQYAPNWRIGHMCRFIPDGYEETLQTGKNLIKDRSLAEYYNKLLLITRGELFDFNRIKTIIEINTGKYDYLIKTYISNTSIN